MKMKNKASKKVAVLGLWHLGCTVAVSLANAGCEVVAIDSDAAVVGDLTRGILPLFEPGLDTVLQRVLKQNKLHVTTDFNKVTQADFVVIAYDTPVNEADQVDMSGIMKIIKKIAPKLNSRATVVVMSQVPVGSCAQIKNIITRGKKRHALEVVYNPENIRLGSALETYLGSERMIVGVSSSLGEDRIKQLYHFYKNPLLVMSLESAEMVKHGINAFLACSISFINELTDISEHVGANIWDVVKGMKSDARIGQKARLSPGLGFAGGTLGRDVRVLETLGKKFDLSVSLISDIYTVNLGRLAVLHKKVSYLLKGIRSPKVALLGLVYKPGTSTLRRSFAIDLAKRLSRDGVVLTGFDPALLNASAKIKHITLAEDPYMAVTGADLAIIITEWPQFADLDVAGLKKHMRTPVLLDPKSVLNAEKAKAAGLHYFAIGDFYGKK